MCSLRLRRSIGPRSLVFLILRLGHANSSEGGWRGFSLETREKKKKKPRWFRILAPTRFRVYVCRSITSEGKLVETQRLLITGSALRPTRGSEWRTHIFEPGLFPVRRVKPWSRDDDRSTPRSYILFIIWGERERDREACNDLHLHRRYRTLYWRDRPPLITTSHKSPERDETERMYSRSHIWETRPCYCL